mgnify:FL=1
MAHTFIHLTHDRTTNQRGRRGRELLRVSVNKALGCIAGAELGSNFTVVGSGTDPAAACTAGISASGSGAVGMVINGVTITETWATSDIVSAGLVATAIRASTDALVQYLVSATNFKAQVTLATVLAGTTINVGGFRFTAIAGTTESNIPGEFTIGGTDTQDGTSFCRALNQHPSASKWFFALNVAGVCHLYLKNAANAYFTAATAGGPNFPQNRVTASAATVTVDQATFIASAHYGVWSLIPGKIGNAFTVAASGTGQTIENSNTRLTRGLGGDAAPVTDNL